MMMLISFHFFRFKYSLASSRQPDVFHVNYGGLWQSDGDQQSQGVSDQLLQQLGGGWAQLLKKINT